MQFSYNAVKRNVCVIKSRPSLSSDFTVMLTIFKVSNNMHYLSINNYSTYLILYFVQINKIVNNIFDAHFITVISMNDAK